MAAQLVLPFGVKHALGRDDFITAPCNEQAFQFIQRWPEWPARAAAIHGPAGCGKSHLAAIWAESAGAQVISARDLGAEGFDSHSQTFAFAIEDIDDAAPNPTRDRALLGLFERPGAWLLLTARDPPAEWKSAIGDLKSRFQSLVAFHVWAPDDVLLCALVVKHLADRQLGAPPAVVARIVTQIERTPEAISRFIARVDVKALAEKRAVTERLVLELLESEAHRGNVA